MRPLLGGWSAIGVWCVLFVGGARLSGRWWWSGWVRVFCLMLPGRVVGGPVGAGGRWLGAGVLPDNAEAAGAVEVEGGDSQVEPQVGLVQSAPRHAFGAGLDLRDFAFGLGAQSVPAEEFGFVALCSGGGEEFFVGVDLEVYLTLRDGSGWDSGRIRWSLAGCGW